MGKTLLLLELNYKASPLHIREKISSQHPEIAESLNQQIVGGVFIAATCHRYAILTYGSSVDDLIQGLREFCPSLSAEHMLLLEGESAIKHFFSTASGLKSRTIGEHEILGQIKAGFRSSKGMAPELNEWVKRAIYTGKRSRTETHIGRYSTSLTAIVGDRIQEHFDDLGNLEVMVYGTGEMARLVLNMLKTLAVGKINIVSKNVARARRFCSNPSMHPLSIQQAQDDMGTCHVVIGATWTSEHLISPANLSEDGQQKVFIDLGMPRNFDPDLSEHHGAVLYDLDNINQEVSHALRKRNREIALVDKIIDEEVVALSEWLAFRQYVPQIKQIKTELAVRKDDMQLRINYEHATRSPKEKALLEREGSWIIQQHFSQMIAVLRSPVNEQTKDRQLADIRATLAEALEQFFAVHSYPVLV